MDLLRWIVENCPGELTDFDDRVEVSHKSGEQSTLWRRKSDDVPDGLSSLAELYREFDGMDLFSSTFKIAALSSGQFKNGVRIVFSLDDLRRELEPVEGRFREPVIPFMYQAGIGYYAISISRGCILEWDSELADLGEEYDTLTDIFDEWIAAVS